MLIKSSSSSFYDSDDNQNNKMEGLLSGDHSIPERKGSLYYFKGSNNPSNKYMDLMDSDEDLSFSPSHEDIHKQRIIRSGRLTDGPSHFKNRLHTKSKNLSGVNLSGKKKSRSGKKFQSDINIYD